MTQWKKKGDNSISGNEQAGEVWAAICGQAEDVVRATAFAQSPCAVGRDQLFQKG